MGWLDVGYTLADRKNTSDSWNALVPLTDSESLDLDLEWGPAAWDERHRLVATGGIELPLDIGLVTKMIYASARAFTAITGSNDNGDFSSENDRPQGEGRMLGGVPTSSERMSASLGAALSGDGRVSHSS